MRSELTTTNRERTTLFLNASHRLGGQYSLIEHRVSIEGKESKTPQILLRLSIGLENAGDLIQDLDRGLYEAN